MKLKDKLNELSETGQQNYEKNLEKLLHQVGLERKKSTAELLAPALGIFGAGVAIGATLGVLFAPKKGDKLRGDLRKRLEELKDRSSEQYEDLKDRSEEAIKRLNEKTGREQPSSPETTQSKERTEATTGE